MMKNIVAFAYLYSHSSASLELGYEGLDSMCSYRDYLLECSGSMT